MKIQNLVLGVCLVALAACGKRLEGSMQISNNLTVNTKKGQVQIPSGTYQTVVKASASKATIEMQTYARKVSFTLPAIHELKEKWGEGRVYIRGEQIGQNFDVDLNLDVTSSQSDSQISYESCVYDTRTYQEWVCRDVLRQGRERCYQKPGTNGDERSDFHCERDTYYDRVCGYETRTENIYGQREVEGYYLTLRRTGTLKLIRGGSTVGRLVDGNQTSTSFVRTDTGRCRRNR